MGHSFSMSQFKLDIANTFFAKYVHDIVYSKSLPSDISGILED
jgi:hypothetical protein